MRSNSFMQWLASQTPSRWWNDSGDPDEITQAIYNGAQGVTLNPVLVQRALIGRNDYWGPKVANIDPSLKGQDKVLAVMGTITKEIAKMVEPIFNETKGMEGRVCAQVNPGLAHDAEQMVKMGRLLHSWAPNIAVKLPGSMAGIEAMETLVQEGITVVVTVSFSVAQAIMVAQRYERAAKKAEAENRKPGLCYSVIMVGRLDDYLMDAMIDNHSKATRDDVFLAGVSVVKRAYEIYKKQNYRPILLPSGFRKAMQVERLAGGDMLFSISPNIQDMLSGIKGSFAQKIDEPVEKDIIDRLMTMPDFVRAYEPDGMKPEEFLGYAPLQRTVSQFFYVGWSGIEDYKL